MDCVHVVGISHLFLFSLVSCESKCLSKKERLSIGDFLAISEVRKEDDLSNLIHVHKNNHHHSQRTHKKKKNRLVTRTEEEPSVA